MTIDGPLENLFSVAILRHSKNPSTNRIKEGTNTTNKFAFRAIEYSEVWPFFFIPFLYCSLLQNYAFN